MLTWMRDERELVSHVTFYNYNDHDSVMRASVWFEFFGGLF